MNVGDLEQKAWELDGVRIVVRAPSGAQVIAYTKKNAADKGMSVTDYIKTRIQPCVSEFEVAVVKGDGELVHGRTQLEKVRESYV
jgi:hypothetical protein